MVLMAWLGVEELGRNIISLLVSMIRRVLGRTELRNALKPGGIIQGRKSK